VAGHDAAVLAAPTNAGLVGAETLDAGGSRHRPACPSVL